MQPASFNDKLNAPGRMDSSSHDKNSNGDAGVNDMTGKRLEVNYNNNTNNIATREVDGTSTKSAIANNDADAFSKTYVHTLPSLRLFLKRVGRVMSAVLN